MTGIALSQWTPDASALASGSPYVAYAYSYPHKTAYAPLRPRRALRDLWKDEDKRALYLYVHIPFCEMRCGFCNLFTTASAHEESIAHYMSALRRQFRRVRDAIGGANVARMAVGGGTPTFLSAAQLDELFVLGRELFGVDPGRVPTSVETSPRTAEPDKLRVLRQHGVERVSIGVQSFVESEVNSSGRAQQNRWVDAAIERIRAEAFPILNLDLIYGLPGQTIESWLFSLRAALRWRPEEIYLYPLYVRPLTGLDRWGVQTHDDLRLSCYRAGRDLLLAEGYAQISMRMFARNRVGSLNASEPVYCCQEDGMIGLGCGARSYTRSLHYSSDYAVGASGVREIISRYSMTDDDFDFANYGCELNEQEQRRRWVIKSILRVQGLDLNQYENRFRGSALAHIPELDQLIDAQLVLPRQNTLIPTAAGLELSDAIGPWLYSKTVRQTMEIFDLH